MQRCENPLVIDRVFEDATGLALLFLEDAPSNFRGLGNIDAF